jgi:2-dehydro-3-deoxyphosphogluconate aldolase/(4S)-4-hydroxy-2-oxoglutarate aldolase
MLELGTSFLNRLREVGVVAVIRASSSDEAIEVSHALVRGGIRGIEITFSTPNAEQAISILAKSLPNALIGAGTVLEPEQLARAADAGAAFVVSPHFEETLMRAALDRHVPALPGAFTPTEVVRAWQKGAACVKLFPSSALGPAYLKALRAPLPHIPLMPTGGVDEHNLADWFAAGAVAVGMGGQLVKGSPQDVELRARAVSSAFAAVVEQRAAHPR